MLTCRLVPRRGTIHSGVRYSSAAPHCLAGLRKVPAEIPALVLALGREFFVASSAVGVLGLGCLSTPRCTVRLSFRDL